MPIRDREWQFRAINLTRRAYVVSHHFVNSVDVTEASYCRWQKLEVDVTAASLSGGEMQVVCLADA